MVSSNRYRAFRPLVLSSLLAAAALSAAPAGAAPGTALGPAFEVAAAGMREVAAARSANGAFVVLYQDGGTTLGPLMAQLYNANGSVKGAPVLVTAPQSGAYIEFPSVAMDGTGNFVVVWEEIAGSQPNVKARRFNAAGVLQGDTFLPDGQSSATNNVLSPAVAMNASGQFVIAWLRSGGSSSSIPLPQLGCLADNGIDFSKASIAYRRYQADGAASGAAAQIAAAGAGVDLNVVVCFLVEATAGLNRQPVDGLDTLGAPAVAVGAAGDFSLAWPVTAGAGGALNALGLRLSDSSITLQRYSAAGIPALQQTVQSLPRLGISNASTQTRLALAPGIAINAAGTTVVWNGIQLSPGTPNELQILTRAYAASGLAKTLAPVSAAGGSQVWSYNDYVPSIAATPTGSVLAWRSTSRAGNALPQRIQAQLVDASGKAIGAPIDVADSADGNTLAFIGAPVVVSDSSGNFAVFWTTSNSTETDTRTYGRLYSGH